MRREEGAQEESQPGSSGPESEPDISDIAGDSGKASEPKGKHRLASNSRADDDASKLQLFFQQDACLFFLQSKNYPA